jgi:hypothetical protein
VDLVSVMGEADLWCREVLDAIKAKEDVDMDG